MHDKYGLATFIISFALCVCGFLVGHKGAITVSKYEAWLAKEKATAQKYEATEQLEEIAIAEKLVAEYSANLLK